MMTVIFAYFGITDFAQAGQMTLSEFQLRQRAHVIQQLDKEREMHLQAYLNRAVKAKNRKGTEYIFKKFSDFYDHEKVKRKVLGRSDQTAVDSGLIERAKRMQKYRKEGKDGR